MPSSSLSWQQGLAGRSPAISFLTSAENEIPTTSPGLAPETGRSSSPRPPKVQSTEPVTARAFGSDLQPHTLLALYHTMVMARAIDRRLWVLRRLQKMDIPARVAGFEVVQVAAAAALRPGRDWVLPCQLDLALCLAMGSSPLDVMQGRFGSRAARVVTTPAVAGRHVLHAAGIAYADENDLAEKLQRVLRDGSLVQSYRNRAQARVQEVYDWDYVVDQYERLFAEMAGKPIPQAIQTTAESTAKEESLSRSASA